MKNKVFGVLLSAALTIGTIFTGATQVFAAAPLFTGNYFGSGFDSYESGTMDYSGYTGAEYRTRQAFGYGMYDVSMKAIKNDGVANHEYLYDLGFDSSQGFHQYGFY